MCKHHKCMSEFIRAYTWWGQVHEGHHQGMYTGTLLGHVCLKLGMYVLLCWKHPFRSSLKHEHGEYHLDKHTSDCIKVITCRTSFGVLYVACACDFLWLLCVELHWSILCMTLLWHIYGDGCTTDTQHSNTFLEVPSGFVLEKGMSYEYEFTRVCM